MPGKSSKSKTRYNRSDRTYRRDRHPAQKLLAQSIDVRQILAIISFGESVASDDRIDLRTCFALHLWIQYHRQKEGRQGPDRLATTILKTIRVTISIPLTVSEPAEHLH